MYFNIFFNSYHSGQSTSARNNPPTTKVTPKCLHCRKPLRTHQENEQHKKVCPPKKKKTCKFDNVKFSKIRFNFSFHISLSLLQLKNPTNLKKMATMFSITIVFFVGKNWLTLKVLPPTLVKRKKNMKSLKRIKQYGKPQLSCMIFVPQDT